LPVAAVLGLLYLWSRFWAQNVFASIGVELACVVVLAVGWRWTQGTFLTRWLGRLLAAYLALGLVFLALAITLTFGEILFLLALLALPVWVWDLFIGQPHKGRFARARAERRGYEEVDAAYSEEREEKER
jgi:hypothetical protein